MHYGLWGTTETKKVTGITIGMFLQKDGFLDKQNKQLKRTNTNTTTGQVRVAEQTVTIGGSRIINIDKLKQYTNDLTLHAAGCGGSIVLTMGKQGRG